MTRLKPVLGASMKTRSLASSRLSSLFTSLYGAGAVCPWFDVVTRSGPNAPMCSHIVEEPGPPLYRKVTGRVDGSFTPLFV